ncbi:aspartate--ammonia ligase [Aureibacter tunicatorum]|uniref:Aspartate--ammonia ligase n=1 Tax=Aureibacter tunicatorum TaxID=866807 RepID=A0AAE4BRX0_9BACT|nr:aspartate--ammonia ligase [Aureibacter tunicatorum]MDR6239141.1 aspartate--ammonia ligase [Aureibacter tunicatorum]BDD04933.1 aspartate--ammonia ligase [Aureibacter tunicatorum]
MALKDIYLKDTYEPVLGLRDTEKAIKLIKDFFELSLSSELRLRRFSAPLFVMKDTGLQDDLNAIERPVSFPILDMGDERAEIVHSLAKWKRYTLGQFGIEEGYGIYTDMNAIRPDEVLDNTHSIYVDQWDWERVITKEDRTIPFLQKIVKKIYGSLKRAEYVVYENYPHIKPMLPEEIHFIHAEELLQKYPDLTPKQREDAIVKEHGAVFLMGIGGELSNGEAHDGRAADYDDWTTEGEKGLKGLNGDILVWHPVLERAYELSSMGIRVDAEALKKQLVIRDQEHKAELMFHKKLLADELPLSIGGGIGQSRLCMFLLRAIHIGEVQASLWPEDMKEACAKHKVRLM